MSSLLPYPFTHCDCYRVDAPSAWSLLAGCREGEGEEAADA